MAASGHGRFPLDKKVELNWKDFREWLYTKYNMPCAGIVQDLEFTPISNWIKSIVNDADVLVGDGVWSLHEVNTPLPEWAQQFMVLLDEGARFPEGYRITAKEALSLLVEVT